MLNRKLTLKHSIWLIFILSLTLTILTTTTIFVNGTKEHKLRLGVESDEIIHRIQKRLEWYELALIQAKAFQMQVEKLDQQRLNKYLLDTELMVRYPGMQGLAYIKRISESELTSHLKERRKEKLDYKIWPEQKDQELTSIVYIAPDNWRNVRALGFNMMTEPIRRKAMEKARDSGKPTLSQRLTLMQEVGTNPQPGFILYLPFYGNRTPKTVEERKASLRGYVSSPFRIYDLFSAIFKNDKQLLLDFEIYEDGSPASPATLLYDHDFKWKPGQKPPMKAALVKVLKFNENSYPVYFYPGPDLVTGKDYYLLFLVAILGLATTFLLMRIFFITHQQVEKKRLALNEKDEFISIASHELKTPITSLQLQLEMVRRRVKSEQGKSPTPEYLLKAFDTSIRQVFRINKLIDDLLEISRIEKGKLTFSFEDVDFSELVTEVFESHAEQVAASGNPMKFQIIPGLRINCDRFRMEQVLTNLLTNALKYGDGSLITVRLQKKDGDIVFMIKDQGFGISTKFLEKIFDRFERAEANRSIAGLGLGLYISKQIVHAHGGTIQVKSQEGKGSEFIVHLPVGQKTSDEPIVLSK